MKSLICAFLIIVLLISFAGFERYYLKKISDELTEKVDSVYASVILNDFQKALYDFNALKSRWDRHSKFLFIVSSHSEIDDYEGMLNELFNYIRDEEKAEAMALCSHLKMQTEHIYFKGKVNIENIL